MSRHRNVRSMNYSDEYDGYDDEYGHSVEDDFCISPSDAAQFMYDRNRQPAQISAFFSENDNIAEEDEVENNAGNGRKCSETFQKPPMSQLEEVRLQSCLDEIRNVIGDTIPENIIMEIILKNNFDLSKSLDAVLSYEPSDSRPDEPKPQRERKERNRDDDINDSCIFLQTHAARSEEHPHFSTCSSNQKSHNLSDDVMSLLDHLTIDSPNFPSNLYFSQNSLSKELSVTVNEKRGKFSSIRSTLENKIALINSEMLRKGSELSDDGKMPGNSNSGKQLKFQIPRLQKVRKDSNKENVAEGNESDSDEISFSSLSVLAQQYSTVKVQASSEEDIDLLGIQEGKITGKVSLTKDAARGEAAMEDKIYGETKCDEVTRFCCNKFESTDSLATLDKNQQFKQCHVDKENDNAKLSSEKEIQERFSSMSEHNEIKSVEALAGPSLPTNEKMTIVPVVNTNNTTLQDRTIGLLSLSEIVTDHLRKSASYGGMLHPTSNYNVVKSESCPQFIIPRLHLSQQRTSVSECLHVEGQDEKACSNSMDVIVTDEDSETDNWVIDLKCALKNINVEDSTDGNIIDTRTQVKSNCVESPTLNYVFLPDLPCLLDAAVSSEKMLDQSKSEPSAFGKVLCRKWKVAHMKKMYLQREHPGTISKFTFNTPSPDDNILQYLK